MYVCGPSHSLTHCYTQLGQCIVLTYAGSHSLAVRCVAVELTSSHQTRSVAASITICEGVPSVGTPRPPRPTRRSLTRILARSWRRVRREWLLRAFSRLLTATPSPPGPVVHLSQAQVAAARLRWVDSQAIPRTKKPRAGTLPGSNRYFTGRLGLLPGSEVESVLPRARARCRAAPSVTTRIIPHKPKEPV